MIDIKLECHYCMASVFTTLHPSSPKQHKSPDLWNQTSARPIMSDLRDICKLAKSDRTKKQTRPCVRVIRGVSGYHICLALFDVIAISKLCPGVCQNIAKVKVTPTLFIMMVAV